MEYRTLTPEEQVLVDEENELWNKIREVPKVRDCDYIYMERINEIKNILDSILKNGKENS